MASAKVQLTLTGLTPGSYMFSYEVVDDEQHVLANNKQAFAVPEPPVESGPGEGSLEITVS